MYDSRPMESPEPLGEPSRETAGAPGARPPAAVVVLAFVALLAFWIVLSGKFDALHLIPGIAAAAATAWFAGRLLELPPRPAPGEEIVRLPRRAAALAGYGIWLAVQVVHSALRVARLVLDPRMPISPSVTRIEDRLPHPLARLILAHSITLTPGTVTLDADAEGLTIHSLDRDSAAGVRPDGGPTAARVRRLFRAGA